ncbi:hypothetical protein LZ31DRAFT_556195 [Colletotrichum somersetense]|nr:hypothetical protein LZ31DRAFT_556195 [Colletotrichum somersetense]
MNEPCFLLSFVLSFALSFAAGVAQVPEINLGCQCRCVMVVCKIMALLAFLKCPSAASEQRVISASLGKLKQNIMTPQIAPLPRTSTLDSS